VKYLRIGLVVITALTLLLIHAYQPAQAVSTTIVISQIYDGGNSGATPRNDFIELFNRGNTPVDVTGWTVQYASALGSSWDSTVLPVSNVRNDQIPEELPGWSTRREPG
jgi:hypothetical protein